MKHVTIVDDNSLQNLPINWASVKKFVNKRAPQDLLHFCAADATPTKTMTYLHEQGWNIHALRRSGGCGGLPAVAELLLMQHLTAGDHVTLVTASSRFEPIIAAHPTGVVFMLHRGQVTVGDGHQTGFDIRLIPHADSEVVPALLSVNRGSFGFVRTLDLDLFNGTNLGITRTDDPDSPWRSIIVPGAVMKCRKASRAQVMVCTVKEGDKGEYVSKWRVAH